jgi:hypothetical protein
MCIECPDLGFLAFLIEGLFNREDSRLVLSSQQQTAEKTENP